MNPTTSSSPNRNKWWWILSTVVVLAIAVAAFFIINAPPPPDAPPEKIAAFIGSPAFERTAPGEREKYIERLTADPRQFMDTLKTMPEMDRGRILHSVFQTQMDRRVTEYFALPPKGQERSAYLDKVIDDRIAMAKDAGARVPPPRMSPKQMKDEMEHTPSDQRSRTAEFMKAINNRAKERGVQMPGAPVAGNVPF